MNCENLSDGSVPRLESVLMAVIRLKKFSLAGNLRLWDSFLKSRQQKTGNWLNNGWNNWELLMFWVKHMKSDPMAYVRSSLSNMHFGHIIPYSHWISR